MYPPQKTQPTPPKKNKYKRNIESMHELFMGSVEYESTSYQMTDPRSSEKLLEQKLP